MENTAFHTSPEPITTK